MTLWWPRFVDVQEWLEARGYGARDWGLLDSALHRPLAAFGASDVYPTLWRKAATLLDSIERSHPFVDGNERVGFLLLALVLRGNGVDDSHVSDDDWFEIILDAAAGHVDVVVQAQRIRDLIEQAPGSI